MPVVKSRRNEEEMESYHSDILREEGFQKVGEDYWEFLLEKWWHPKELTQISVIPLSPYCLLKNTKMYRLVGISKKGETFLRDLNNFHAYLQGHFPEIHISESIFRDPNLNLIYKRIGCVWF